VVADREDFFANHCFENRGKDMMTSGDFTLMVKKIFKSISSQEINHLRLRFDKSNKGFITKDEFF
jgi:Ca2+-binding EF-hand superfamily protein